MRKFLIFFQFLGLSLADGETEIIEILPGKRDIRTLSCVEFAVSLDISVEE